MTPTQKEIASLEAELANLQHETNMTFPSQSTTIAREGNVDSPGACASRGEDGTTVAGANTPPPRSIGWNNGGRKFKALGYLQRRGLYYRRTKGFWANLVMTQNEH